MKIITVFSLLSFSISLNAQKSPAKFGDIPMEDMKMKIYSKDSSATAVVLFDYGISYLVSYRSGARAVFERHRRVKVLNKQGFEKADILIPLNRRVAEIGRGNSTENLTSLKAVTYNLENGKIVETPLQKDGLFKESFNKYYILRKFSMPNVKEGSIIEYTYKKESDFVASLPNWEFQDNIPVRWSEFWAMIPEFFVFEKYMQGYLLNSYQVEPMDYRGYPVNAHHWISKDLPAFKKEPYMRAANNYISKINFALSAAHFPGQSLIIMGSWEKLKEDLLQSQLFGGAIYGSTFLKDKVDEITSGITDPTQKINAIAQYIKDNIEWDGSDDFLTDDLQKIMEKRRGSSGDINALLGAMLNNAGLEVDMLLLSTKDHGFIRETYPMTKQFNYSICAVKLDGRHILLDCTEKYLGLDLIPTRCLNNKGYLISKKNFGWLDLETKAKAKSALSIEMHLDQETQLKGKLSVTHSGYSAFDLRKNYHKDGEEEYLKSFSMKNNCQIEKSEFKYLPALDKPVTEAYELVIDQAGSKAGDVIYINPILENYRLDNNPFKSEERIYPLDFESKIDQTYFAKISVPDGYIIEEVPKNKLMVLPGNAGKYVYSVAQINNTLNVTTNFQINQTLFSQEQYLDLREFYNQVVAKQAEQIVLKKK